MEENKKPVVALSDQERFPLISDLSFLMALRQDEYAPYYNFQSGDRLTTFHLDRVREYAKVIRGSKHFWENNSEPEWLNDYLAWCIKTVPFYRNRPEKFNEQPTIRRGDICKTPWNFVSAESNLDDLLVYQTSGTTGPPMDVLFDPITQACWLPMLQSVLDQYGIRLEERPDRVSIALICSQNSTLTYSSLSTYLNGAGVLKINLNASDWKKASDRVKFLEKYNPEILTGDPFSFIDLLELQPKITPKAMVSSAMKMTEGVREKLEAYFSCPVIDIYSLTECRMVAFAEKNRHKAIRHDLFFEIFDREKDLPLPYGERGELVITGGNNLFLPLIRYRTGDFCKLEIDEGIPYLVDLEARDPVAFYTRDGKRINNIDISREMCHFSLAGFQLHQTANYQLEFIGWSNDDLQDSIKHSLRNIFGVDAEVQVSIQPIEKQAFAKPLSYSSDLIFNQHE